MSSALDLARRLEEHISHNALAGRELKSLAQSIGYRLSFFSPMKRLNLTNELVFLNAFMGSAAIRACANVNPGIPGSDVEQMADEYVSKLLSRWLPDSMRSDYEERLSVWRNIVLDPSDADAYAADLRVLVDTFYVSLTKNPLDEQSELMLTGRFNGYMKLHMQSVMSLMQHFYPGAPNG